MRQVLIAVLAALTTSCASASPTNPSAAVEPTIELSLASATLDDVAVAVSSAGVPIAIDGSASTLASCVHVTVRTAGRVPRAQAFALLAASLEETGLALTQTSGGWVVRLSGSSPVPASCGEWLAQTLLGGLDSGDRDLLGEPRSPLPVPAAPDPAAPADATSTTVLAGIRRVSDTEVVITRAAADAMLQQPSGSMQSARAIPHIVDGRSTGVRLFGLRAASPMAALGLQNGDVVLTVGGRSIATPDAALEAYSALRDAVRIPIRVQRQGQERELVVRIVDALPE